MSPNELIEKYVSSQEKKQAYKLLEQGVPIQYIIGNVNFCGFKINVDKRVLIPRFETEFLVDETVKKAQQIFNKWPINILDLGTGSGCIAISLAKLIPAQVTALDISLDALKVAKQNALLNKVDINFVKQSMTKKVVGKFDIIISNPPYIGKNAYVEDMVKNNEPALALFTKDDGLYFYKKILNYAFDILNKPGFIAFEIGDNEKEFLEKLIKPLGKKYEFKKDYANLFRYLFIFNE